MVAPDSPADSATGCFVPEGLDGGQDQWKGKIVRIAHLGYVDTFDVIIAISALEMALKKMGHNVTLGEGVSAA